MNEIIKIEITGTAAEGYVVAVTKHFAPEHGGGSQVFTESGGSSLHRALDVARGMVTLSPGTRTDVPLDLNEQWEQARRDRQPSHWRSE